MADELDLKELRLEIKQLRTEVARLEKEKQPRSNALHKGLVMTSVVGILILVISRFGPEFGIGQSRFGEFSSVEARNFRIRDDEGDRHGTINIDSTGPFVSMHATNSKRVDLDSKSLRLENDADSVRVDSSMVRLTNERGTLILELNEKGKPVLRSIPAKSKSMFRMQTAVFVLCVSARSA